MVQLTIAFAVLNTLAGLITGYRMSNRQPCDDIKGALFVLGGIGAVILVLILLVFSLSAFAFEALGVVLGLAIFLCFMDIGMLLNPYRKE